MLHTNTRWSYPSVNGSCYLTSMRKQRIDYFYSISIVMQSHTLQTNYHWWTQSSWYTRVITLLFSLEEKPLDSGWRLFCHTLSSNKDSLTTLIRYLNRQIFVTFDNKHTNGRIFLAIETMLFHRGTKWVLIHRRRTLVTCQGAQKRNLLLIIRKQCDIDAMEYRQWSPDCFDDLALKEFLKVNSVFVWWAGHYHCVIRFLSEELDRKHFETDASLRHTHLKRRTDVWRNFVLEKRCLGCARTVSKAE